MDRKRLGGGQGIYRMAGQNGEEVLIIPVAVLKRGLQVDKVERQVITLGELTRPKTIGSNSSRSPQRDTSIPHAKNSPPPPLPTHPQIKPAITAPNAFFPKHTTRAVSCLLQICGEGAHKVLEGGGSGIVQLVQLVEGVIFHVRAKRLEGGSARPARAKGAISTTFQGVWHTRMTYGGELESPPGRLGRGSRPLLPPTRGRLLAWMPLVRMFNSVPSSGSASLSASKFLLSSSTSPSSPSPGFGA